MQETFLSRYFKSMLTAIVLPFLLSVLCRAQEVNILDEMEFVEHIVMPEEVMYRVRSGVSDFLIIDVREHAAFSEGHILGAESYPLVNNAFTQAADFFPKERDIFLVSRDGKNGFVALRFLLERGYTRVFNIEGGMENWLYWDLITE